MRALKFDNYVYDASDAKDVIRFVSAGYSVVAAVIVNLAVLSPTRCTLQPIRIPAG